MGARSQQYGYDGYDGYGDYGYDGGYGGNAYASRRASPPALVPEWVWKLGSMLVAAAVVCFGFFLVKNVNELLKTNRRSKARVALPTKPAVEDAKSRRRRERDERNAGRRREADARAAAERARRLAEDAARDEAKRMKAEEKASRQAATIALRSAAATTAQRRWRGALAARFAARVAAARYVQRAWRYPGVLGARRAVRKARRAAKEARRAAEKATAAAAAAARRARTGLLAWPLQARVRARVARRVAAATALERVARGNGGRAAAAAARARAATDRGSRACGVLARVWRDRLPRRRHLVEAARLIASERRDARDRARKAEQRRLSRDREAAKKRDKKVRDELAREAAAAARRAAAALWSSLRHGDACAALAVAGAGGPRADRVNGVYRRSLAGAAPLFRRAPRHDRGVVASFVFVAERDGVDAWVVGDEAAKDARAARGWATAAVAAVGAPPARETTFLVSDGKGGLEPQVLRVAALSAAELRADDSTELAERAAARAAAAAAAAGTAAAACARASARLKAPKKARATEARVARENNERKRADAALGAVIDEAAAPGGALADLRGRKKRLARALGDEADATPAAVARAEAALADLEGRVEDAKRDRDARQRRDVEAMADAAVDAAEAAAFDLLLGAAVDAAEAAAYDAADAALDPALLALCFDCGIGRSGRHALYTEQVLSLATLRVVDDADLAAVLGAPRDARLVREALSLCDARDAAEDADFFFG